MHYSLFFLIIKVMPTSDLNIQQLSEKRTILDVLREDNLITGEQYDNIKVKSANQNVSPLSILESMNILSEKKLAEEKAKLVGIPFMSLDAASFSPQAIGLISKAVVERFSLIPFAYDDKAKTLSVAMSNPVDLEAIQFLSQKTGLTIKSYASSKEEVDKAISEQYSQEIVGEVDEALKETAKYEKTKTVDSRRIGEIIKEAPIAKVVSTILEYAVTSRASDVHIEPQEDRVRVRYRIDGILYDKLTLPKNVQDAVTSRIKILSAMKIDEHRSPQDGRFNFKVSSEEVDLRISVLPTVHGEKVVMRLLRKTGGIPSLDELGLTGNSLRNLETAMLRPHGIILVCGPTGSGKTTTLYSVLTKINTTRINILTLEDPIEYQLPGVNQVAVNLAVGLTFATGLRAFLRQDPNIILVGEIRDRETTDLALQASLTGHLVFSTLHTSDASGALPRLLDLGAENFLLASTINAIVGQRIVRRLCTNCKEEYEALPQILEEKKKTLGKLFPSKPDLKLSKGKGCDQCGKSGYLGRIGIFETLPVTPKITSMVLENADSDTIEREAILEGMITMKQDGYIKVLNGITTVEEVLRVAQ